MNEWIKELAMFLHLHSWRLDVLALVGTNLVKTNKLLQKNNATLTSTIT